MIRSFADGETRKVFEGRRSHRLPADIQRVARRKLLMVDAAETISDLRAPPGHRLEALGGDRTGQRSIRVNERWRVCFVWTVAGPEDVEIVDYH